MLCLKSYNHRLVRKEFLGTVFNKHIAIDLFISGRRCRNNVPIFSILQSAASLLPWATAAILLLLGDSQDPGERKQVILSSHWMIVTILSSHWLRSV